jgi:hypothetical protein
MDITQIVIARALGSTADLCKNLAFYRGNRKYFREGAF